MILLLFFFFPFLEIYLFYKAIAHFGFMDTALWVITAFALGMGLTATIGRSILLNVQVDLAQGKLPLRKAMHKALIVFAGFLFMIPGLGSDAIAVLLVLPGTRHLAVFYLDQKLKLAMATGSARFFTAGFGQRPQNFRRQSPFPEEARFERDAEIIDVTPINIESKNKS